MSKTPTAKEKKHQSARTCLDPIEISSHRLPPPASGLPGNPSPVKQPSKNRAIAARERAISANRKMAGALREYGETDLARDLKRCGVSKQLWVCGDCGDTSYVDYSCRKRICALCAWKQAKERATQVEQLFKTMSKPKWLTLTMERANDLGSGVRKIRQAFSKWRRLKSIKKRIRGGIYQIECKPKADGWHVHLHVLIDAEFIPKPIIWRTWAYSLNQKIASVDIQGNLSGSKVAHYICKYATKPHEISAENADAALDYLDTLTNQRLFGTFGNCHNALEKPKNGEPLRCPHCGGHSCYLPFHLGYKIFGGDEWHRIARHIQGDKPEWIEKIPDHPPPLFDETPF